MAALIVLFVAGLWAGVQNALAGGGSFVTLPALILSGIDARWRPTSPPPSRCFPASG